MVSCNQYNEADESLSWKVYNRLFDSKITFEAENGTTDSRFQCPVGNFMCSHVVAVLLFAQKMLSRTDFPSVWSRPATASHEEICGVNVLKPSQLF